MLQGLLMKRVLMVVESLLWLGYMGLIYWLSSGPMPAAFVIPISQIDKVYHFLAYAVLGALGCQVAHHVTRHLYWRIWLGGMAASLFGISDEWHQFFVPGRSATVSDIVADMCGAWAGAMIWGLWLSPLYKTLTSLLKRNSEP